MGPSPIYQLPPYLLLPFRSPDFPMASFIVSGSWLTVRRRGVLFKRQGGNRSSFCDLHGIHQQDCSNGDVIRGAEGLSPWALEEAQ